MQIDAFGQLPSTEDKIIREQLKQFVASPPPIKNIVFKVKITGNGNGHPHDGSFALSTTFEYFHARWQTNGVLFRKLSKPEDATNSVTAGELVSWSGHEHVLLEPEPRITRWDDRDPTVSGKSNSVFYTSKDFLHPLQEVMNLGVLHAGIGAIRWDGDNFQTACKVLGVPVLITGSLVSNGGGLPIGLEVHYAMSNWTNDYLVHYGYANERRYSFLPTSITNLLLAKTGNKGRHDIELNEWHIIDVETADNPLDAETFSSLPFVNSTPWPVTVYTNGAFYDRQTNGALKFSHVLRESRDFTDEGAAIKSPTFYWSWALLNFALFALVLKAKETEMKTNSTSQIL